MESWNEAILETFKDHSSTHHLNIWLYKMYITALNLITSNTNAKHSMLKHWKNFYNSADDYRKHGEERVHLTMAVSFDKKS